MKIKFANDFTEYAEGGGRIFLQADEPFDVEDGARLLEVESQVFEGEGAKRKLVSKNVFEPADKPVKTEKSKEAAK